jgi:DNA-binding response OmpR family regulator
MADISRRAMIVEDDPRVAFLYRKTLEHEGFSVAEECPNANEALLKFKDLLNGNCGQSAKPEIVICDKDLPDEGGVELSQKLLSADPRLTILLATGDTEISSEMAQRAGIKKVFRKPFPVEELLSTISDAQNTGELDQIVR